MRAVPRRLRPRASLHLIVPSPLYAVRRAASTECDILSPNTRPAPLHTRPAPPDARQPPSPQRTYFARFTPTSHPPPPPLTEPHLTPHMAGALPYRSHRSPAGDLHSRSPAWSASVAGTLAGSTLYYHVTSLVPALSLPHAAHAVHAARTARTTHRTTAHRTATHGTHPTRLRGAVKQTC